MATKTYYFTGDCKWARTKEHDPKYLSFSVALKHNDKLAEDHAASGLTGKFNVDNEGDAIVRYRRQPSRADLEKGIPATPPIVVGPDGQPLNELIGNGSNVTLAVDVYDYKWGGQTGKGHRLQAVRVNNLVPYSKPDNGEQVPAPRDARAYFPIDALEARGDYD